MNAFQSMKAFQPTFDLRSDLRMWMSYNDLSGSLVASVPIRDGDKLIGCLIARVSKNIDLREAPITVNTGEQIIALGFRLVDEGPVSLPGVDVSSKICKAIILTFVNQWMGHNRVRFSKRITDFEQE